MSALSPPLPYSEKFFEEIAAKAKNTHQCAVVLSSEASSHIQALMEMVEKNAQECISKIRLLEPGTNVSGLLKPYTYEMLRELAHERTQIRAKNPPFKNPSDSEAALNLVDPLYQSYHPPKQLPKVRSWPEYALEVEQRLLHSHPAFQTLLTAIKSMTKDSPEFLSHPILHIAYAPSNDSYEMWITPFIRNMKQDLEALGIVVSVTGDAPDASETEEAKMEDRISISTRTIVIGSPTLATQYLQGNPRTRAQFDCLHEKRDTAGFQTVIPLLLCGEKTRAFPKGFADSVMIANSPDHNRINYLQLVKLIGETLFDVSTYSFSKPREKWNQLWKAFAETYPVFNTGISQKVVEEEIEKRADLLAQQQEIHQHLVRELLKSYKPEVQPTPNPRSSEKAPTSAPMSKNAFTKIHKLLKQEKFSEAKTDLVIAIASAKTPKEIEECYTCLQTLIPKVEEEEYRQLETHLAYLLAHSEKMPILQHDLALRLATWHRNQAPDTTLETQLIAYKESITYYAKATQIARVKKKDALKGLHRLASSLLSQMIKTHLIDHNQFEQILDSSRRGGESKRDKFTKQIADIEHLKTLCCSNTDRKLIKQLYRCAKRVLEPVATDEMYIEFSRAISQASADFELSEHYATERYHEALVSFRNHFDTCPKIGAPVADVRVFQTKISDAFRTFFAILLKDAFAILGPPPCGYDIRAVGSFGRQEMSPFSALKPMLLIEDASHKKYFQNLIHLLELQVMSLGETSSSSLVFHCIHAKNPSGFHLDGNSEAVQTPEEMALLEDPALKSNSIAQSTPELFAIYQDHFKKEHDKQTRQTHALDLFKTRLSDYRKRWKEPLATHGQIVQMKTQVVELLNYLINDMALYWQIETANTIDIIDALPIFTKKDKTFLKEAVAAAYQIRLRLHSDYGEQKEETYFGPELESELSRLKPSEVQALERIYWIVLRPLYAHLEEIEKGALPEKVFCKRDLVPFSFLKDVHPAYLPKDVAHFEPLVRHFADYVTTDHEDHYRALSQLPASNQDLLRRTYLKALDRRGMGQEADRLALHPNHAGLRQAMLRDEKRLHAQLIATTASLPPKGKTIVEMKFSLSDEVRYLKPEIMTAILDANGHIKDGHPGSLHHVASAQGLYFKEKPGHPLMEYAVHNLTSRVGGGLTPSTELVRFNVSVNGKQMMYPVLVSQEVNGQTLQNISDSAQPDIAQWTWHLLCAILTRPRDGRRSNYILDETTGAISCIDNDLSFTEPVLYKNMFGKATKKTHRSHKKVLFLSALFCLFPTDQALDPDTLKAFCALDSEAILSGWLHNVIAREKAHLALFSEQEHQQIYKKDQADSFLATILFPKGALATLSLQFWLLQNTIRKTIASQGDLYPKDLLQELISLQKGFSSENRIGGHVYRHYQSPMLLPTMSGRLDAISAKTKNMSISHTETQTESFGKPLALSEIKGGYRLEQAREELNTSLLRTSFDEINLRMQQSKMVIKGDFSKLSNHPTRELFAFQALIGHMSEADKPAEVSLRGCSLLDSANLDNFLHESLEVLDISKSKKIKDQDIITIADRSPRLKKLSLNHCPKLKNVCLTTAGTFPWSPVTQSPVRFEELDCLEISHCSNLTTLICTSEPLEEVKVKHNSRLGRIALETDRMVFGRLDCKGSPNVDVQHNISTTKVHIGSEHFYLFGVLSWGKQIAFKSIPFPFQSVSKIPGDFQMRLTALDLTRFRVSESEISKCIQFCPNLNQLFLSSNIIRDEVLSEIATLSSLTTLEVAHGDQITDSGLEHLRDLATLTSLNLERCWITDSGLEHLSGLSALTSLNLGRCKQINNSALERLSGLTTLTSLNLEQCWITDNGLEHLSGLSALTSLTLRGCKQINNSAFACLSGLSALTSLNLGGCLQIRDSGLERLSGLSALTSLNLGGCLRITDSTLEHLSGLSALTSLTLRGCLRITESGLARLSGLSALTSLNLSGCLEITDSGLARLSGLTALTSLNLGWCKEITDSGLARLSGLSALTSLNLARCEEITDSGLARLSGLSALTSLNLSECDKITNGADAGLRLQGIEIKH